MLMRAQVPYGSITLYSIVVMEARIAQVRPFVGNTRTYINYPFGQFVHDPAVNHPVR